MASDKSRKIAFLNDVIVSCERIVLTCSIFSGDRLSESFEGCCSSVQNFNLLLKRDEREICSSLVQLS